MVSVVSCIAGSCDKTLSANLTAPLPGLSASLNEAPIGLSASAETVEPASAGAETLVRRLPRHAERRAEVGPGRAEQASAGDARRGLASEPLSGAERLPGLLERFDALEFELGR